MTAVAVPAGRAATNGSPVDDWLLTAPWWHWPKQAPTAPRDTVPALQKYATTQFAADFLADPQRRLVFDAVADRGALPPVDPATMSLLEPAPTDAYTKLYLPTHHRHYLVTVELHCDRPGLPSPDHSAACEAGFVIRRRRADVPDELRPEARRLTRKVARASARLRVIDRRLAAAARRGRVGASALTALTEQRRRANTGVDAARQELLGWADAQGIERSLEGWVPLGVDGNGAVVLLDERPAEGVRPLPGLGRWVPVAEIAETLTEATFPLYPLIPDPREPHHDAAGRCIYFGTVPTSTTDLEQLDPGAADDPLHPNRPPRLDDLSLYEIRCVVRRHDPRCPRRFGVHDCHGPLTWSEPTPPFLLASPLDPRGTANRPVTVRMPTRAELAAAALTSAKGYGGVRVQAGDYPVSGADFQICSFSIPLITIVATFVLRIFLPIVVFLFGLWVLLALKICIPPSITASADLQLALDADGPSADFEAQFGVEVSGLITAGAGGALADLPKAGVQPDPSPDAGDAAANAGDDRFALVKAMTCAALRTPTDDLVYEQRIERAEVLGT